VQQSFVSLRSFLNISQTEALLRLPSKLYNDLRQRIMSPGHRLAIFAGDAGSLRGGLEITKCGGRASLAGGLICIPARCGDYVCLTTVERQKCALCRRSEASSHCFAFTIARWIFVRRNETSLANLSNRIQLGFYTKLAVQTSIDFTPL
jgi:hypothetical protein